MFSVLSALWPVFALLMIGFAGRKSGFPGDGFWEPAEKLTYFVLFPVLLVSKLSTADMAGVAFDNIALAIVVLLVVGSVLCLCLKPIMHLSSAAFTSFYQGAIRFNTYVALAVATAIFGEDAIALSAIVVALMIPLINLLCVLVFSIHIPSGKGVSGFLRTLVKNPLILACILGIGLNVSGVGLHAELLSVAQLLGQMALPLGLLAVGAGLNIASLRSAQSAMWLSGIIKLLLFPLFMLFFAQWMELSPLVTGLLVVFAAVPTAPSGYILARQLGGDAQMMAAIITGQTVLSILTLPLVLWLAL